MCLKLRTDHTVPYNDSKIRYKFASGHDKYIFAPFTSVVYAPIGQWAIAEHNYKHDPEALPHDVGFHVFTSQDSAIAIALMSLYDVMVIKVEVDDFIASGTFNNAETETWKKMKILKVIF